MFLPRRDLARGILKTFDLFFYYKNPWFETFNGQSRL